MRERVFLQHVGQMFVGAACFNEIEAIVPDHTESGYLYGDFDAGDPRVSLVMEALARHGVRPAQPFELTASGSRVYRYWRLRLWEEEELFAAKYFAVWLHRKQDLMETFYRGPNGVQRISKWRAHRRTGFGTGFRKSVLASNHSMKILCAAGLKGIRFEPVEVWSDADVTKGRRLKARDGAEWWEMSSDVELPAGAVRNEIVDVPNNFVGLDSKLEIVEDHYVPPQLQLSRQLVEQAAPFDIAKTFEKFGPYRTDDSRLTVVSQRFYRVCREHKLDIALEPVKLVD